MGRLQHSHYVSILFASVWTPATLIDNRQAFSRGGRREVRPARTQKLASTTPNSAILPEPIHPGANTMSPTISSAHPLFVDTTHPQTSDHRFHQFYRSSPHRFNGTFTKRAFHRYRDHRTRPQGTTPDNFALLTARISAEPMNTTPKSPVHAASQLSLMETMRRHEPPLLSESIPRGKAGTETAAASELAAFIHGHWWRHGGPLPHLLRALPTRREPLFHPSIMWTTK